ncbi:MAG TPA: hypothetical protein VEV41_13965 [Terriglobales bacterium]|nr:hypothetical protein [Terriglobales bacterium]
MPLRVPFLAAIAMPVTSFIGLTVSIILPLFVFMLVMLPIFPALLVVAVIVVGAFVLRVSIPTISVTVVVLSGTNW